jgi:hypothetical protein
MAQSGSNRQMPLTKANFFGKLPEALNDTSSVKAIRNAERTAQKFGRRKLNRRVQGKQIYLKR